MKGLYLFPFFIFASCVAFQAQQKSELSKADKSALEGIIVESYYVSDSADYVDSLGDVLKSGAITYRIYVDMKPDYTLQLIYGSQKHPLSIQTSTTFYNNADCGALIGYNVNYLKINRGKYALDSWITINSATNHYAGILKSHDKDGSIIERHSLNKADGLTNGNLPTIKPFNLDMNFFDNDSNAVVFSTTNGGWAAISGVKSGVKGPTTDNRVLIAQLTTNGILSFELNVQLGTPSGGVVNFVAKNPESSEIKFEALTKAIKP